MTLHQGDCVHLATDLAISAGLPGGESSSTWTIGETAQTQDTVYQVIGVDALRDRCWVRRWPLARHGSPVFEVSIRQVELHHLPQSRSCPSRS
ncbi:hypothetical protein VB734_02390 [Synechococcus sp. BA-124 BA4]|jgi:hypothetical protein|uniref:hypothetical protein n=1 Tax=unclassified Synechococcus TaxID=2626047 RepID=UPI002AD3DC3B|nr:MULTISPECIES: hypothetical protein [unclassified Synechococcus]MEA5398889.1 hypothetical protein [Synechococcus sp. BA-124 BA4]CAK6693980.1 hypothetical protein BBFGKLBO_01552 [Synechococcus sp. CBW1107]